jgi:hypothetical protein
LLNSLPLKVFPCFQAIVVFCFHVQTLPKPTTISESNMSDPDAEYVTEHTAQPTGGTPPPPQVNGGPAEHKQTNGSTGTHKRRRNLHRAPVWIEAACAILLVLITGFYTFYAARQANASKKSAKAALDAAIAAKQAANAASANAEIAYWALLGSEETSAYTLGQMAEQTAIQKKAADSAAKSVSASREALRLDQRAWVGIRDFNCDSCSETTDSQMSLNSIIVTAINTGKTPALRMHGDNAFMWIKESDPVPDPDRYFVEEAIRVRKLMDKYPADYAKSVESGRPKELEPVSTVLAPNAYYKMGIGAGVKWKKTTVDLHRNKQSFMSLAELPTTM